MITMQILYLSRFYMPDCDYLYCIIGYEPADLTVHPPPPQNDRGWVHFFRIGV